MPFVTCGNCGEKVKYPAGTPDWMLTYGDMTTLLLTFFVMMFTTAEVDGREFQLILTAFQGSLGMMEGGNTLSKGKLEEMGLNVSSLPSMTRGKKMAKSRRRAVNTFKPEIQAKKIRVTEDERGIVITLTSDNYYSPGSADISPAIKSVLNKVAVIVNQLPNNVRIEGHTDNTPVNKDSKYKDNWELSSARATEIVRYLINKKGVDKNKLSAVGYADTRPIDDNNLASGRAYNRRVDIIILRDEERQTLANKEFSE